jgi:hypothetical protein
VSSGALPRTALAVLRDGEWREWWRAERAPARWSGGSAPLRDAVEWRRAGDGLSWGELRLAGSGEAWRVRLVVARVDPRRWRLRHHPTRRDDGRAGPWSIDRAPDDAALALNAGMFGAGGPWGWVVMGGRELRPPGTGPLSMAVVVDTAGAVALVPAEGIAAARERGDVAEAFQSYPAVLAGDGEVPLQLRAPGRGVDLEHRDARIAVGLTREGELLVVLTRFDALDGALDFVPFGLTVPEMGAVMGALGARRAVLLDGGISSQLALRDAAGARRAWPGLREVALGLVAVGRGE